MELNYDFFKSRPKIGHLSTCMRYVCDIFMVVLLGMLRVIFLTYLYDMQNYYLLGWFSRELLILSDTFIH